MVVNFKSRGLTGFLVTFGCFKFFFLFQAKSVYFSMTVPVYNDTLQSPRVKCLSTEQLGNIMFLSLLSEIGQGEM